MFLSQVAVGSNICESSETYCCHPIFGSFYVSGKLPTSDSSPEPTLTLSSYLGQNVGVGEG